MNKTILSVAIGAVAMTVAVPLIMKAQGKPTQATYITKEEVDKVNALPGVDRTIKVLDIGGEHFSVGIIHRVAPAAGAGRGAGGRGRGTPPPPDCGVIGTAPTSGGAAGTIAHDSQTEGYLIVSGGGTMLTGGQIYNGHKSAPDSEVTTTLNGPSCSGTAYGDVVRREVKVGDIIIIPAGVPHGWTGITTEVTYLSFRPSGQILTPGYVNPAIK
jgi:mannose-6-phosphate isomerase-like protein (cupin superfamily)